MRCHYSECFWLVETSFTFEIMNIWKSYMWTAEWRIIWRKIIAVVYATYACSCEKKAWKQIQAVNVDHASPIKNSVFYRIRTLLTSALSVGSALPIKLTSQLGVGRWSWFVINPWKDNDEIMNIWKSYMWTAEWRIIWRKVIAFVYATYACSWEKKAWKKIQAVNVDHAQELTGMGKGSTDIAFFCVFWINTIK